MNTCINTEKLFTDHNKFPEFHVQYSLIKDQFSSVTQSVMSDSATPWTAACQTTLSITNSRSLLKFMPIKSIMPPNHLILCHPLLFLPSIFPSIRVFCSESALHTKWAKHWRFSFSISPSSKYSGLISYRVDWLDSLVIQGVPKSFLQHCSSKASIHPFSASFFL